MTRLRFLASFFDSVAFLTRIPVPTITNSKQVWQRSPLFYPFVGFLIGCILVGCSLLFQWIFPQPLSAVLTMVTWVLITGGLHLDGWMDLADGLGSNRPKERILEIMKDSRVGAMGVLAAILLLFVKTAAVFDLENIQLQNWLFVAPLYARTVLLFAIRFFPYIREKGMGSDLAQGITGKVLGSCMLFVVIVPFLLFSIEVAAIAEAIAILSLVFGWLLAKRIQTRLGGLTGDCYGALVECTEVFVLVTVLFFAKWLPL